MGGQRKYERHSLELVKTDNEMAGWWADAKEPSLVYAIGTNGGLSEFRGRDPEVRAAANFAWNLFGNGKGCVQRKIGPDYYQYEIQRVNR